MKTNRAKILLIYTGGTIGMVKDFHTGELRAFDFNKLLERIPELYQLDCDIETHSFEVPIDSSNMNIQHWLDMAEIVENRYDEFNGFVILHGSDTMSYSASALSFMLENLSKPVVLTGSQLPIGDLRTDAKENLITAIQIASLQNDGEPLVQEVCLYFEYKLYRGNRTTKISAEQFNAFASPNFPPIAESGVHLRMREDLLKKSDKARKRPFVVHKNFCDQILVLRIFPGLNEKVLNVMLNVEGVRGIILETYGAGNAPTEPWFVKCLQDAIDRGVFIVNVTQCSGGSVMMGNYETSSQLKKIGLISGKDITTEAAIAKMMYMLGENVSNKVFKTIFETSIRGEMR